MRRTFTLTLLCLAPVVMGCGGAPKEPVTLPPAEQKAAEDAYSQEAEAAMAAEAAEQAANRSSQ